MAEQGNFNSTQSAPKVGDDDLYAQIAAGDQEEEAPHTRSSLTMNLMVSYMRWMLLIDAKRRQYQKVFRIFDGIWAILMTILYLMGLVMLLILIISYLRFPTEIQRYLNVNGIICDQMEIPTYANSRVNLKGLHDKDNTYRIDSLSISSTFSDFLNHRARNVSVKGVKITFDPNNEKVNNLIMTLARLNQRGANSGGLQIDSLEVSDATVTFKGKDITIPVSFSLTGVYGNGTNISAFINVDDPSLKINGPLMIKDVANGLQWDLNIINGQIAFPGRSLEKMTGKIGFQTNGLLLQSVAGDVSIFTNQERRDIGIKLDKKRGLFSGSMALKWWDTTKATKPEMRTTLDLNVADLKLLGNGVVQTNHPIQIALTTQYSKSLQIKELVGSLNGQLTCQLFDNCSYHLTKPAMFSVKRISLYEQGYEVRSKPRYRFSLDPVKDFWNMSFKTGRVNFKFQSKNFVFNGEQVESKSDISIKTILGRIEGYLNLWSKDISAKVELNGLEYQSPTVNMRQSYLLAEDILDENARFYLRSHHINLKNNPRIKVPFYLEYTKNKGISDIVVSLENRGIQLLFGGVVDWIGGNVNGQLVVPGIALGSLKQPLNRISDLFPAEFKKTYGKISAYGRLSGNLYSGLNGPMYLSLMDFGFETDDIEVQHLNAALTAQTLSPFTTEPNQRIHIGEIKSFLPITNVDIILKAEDNYAQLHDVTAQVAGIPLVAGETVVPYKNIGTLIYFKNQDENLAPMLKNVGGDTWKIASMRGSILLPVEIKNMTLNVKNAMLDILGANLQYTGNSKKRPNFLSKDDQMNITSGTVSFDGDGQARKGVKISILWDVIMLPSRLKKTIRETMSIKDLGLLDFGSVRGQEPPSDIMQKVRYIQDKADAFRMK